MGRLFRGLRDQGPEESYDVVIIGAGINHWYHANLMYRAGIHALMFCGCVGVNGDWMETSMPTSTASSHA